jgi:hypothetical protein
MEKTRLTVKARNVPRQSAFLPARFFHAVQKLLNEFIFLKNLVTNRQSMVFYLCIALITV